MGCQVGEEAAEAIRNSVARRIRVVQNPSDSLILNTIAEEDLQASSTRFPGSRAITTALLKVYARLRPGNPPQVEKAKQLFHEKFFDDNRYRLGKVGRFRINRKFNMDVRRRRAVPARDRLPEGDPVHAGSAFQPRGPGDRPSDRDGRRHRPPGQPPSADARRAGGRGAPQGLPEAPPDGAGADEREGPRGGREDRGPGQLQVHHQRRSTSSSAAASCRRSWTRRTRCRRWCTSVVSRRWGRAA